MLSKFVHFVSGISQRKTNTTWYHLYVESEKIQQISEYNRKETESQIEQLEVTSGGRLCRGGGGKLGVRYAQGCTV